MMDIAAARERIIGVVSQFMDVSEVETKNPSFVHARARFTVWYVLRTFGFSFQAIAASFKRDHSTIQHGVARAEEYVDADLLRRIVKAVHSQTRTESIDSRDSVLLIAIEELSARIGVLTDRLQETERKLEATTLRLENVESSLRQAEARMSQVSRIEVFVRDAEGRRS